MDDLISRQTAIDYLLDALYDLDEADYVDKEFIEEEMKKVPSIQPEQKTGRWELAIGYDPKRKFMCDQCARMAYEPSKYCPNCGAKMEK